MDLCAGNPGVEGSFTKCLLLPRQKTQTSKQVREPLDAHRTTVTVVGVDSLPGGVLDNRSVTGEAVKSVHQLSETSQNTVWFTAGVKRREKNETI